MYHIIISILIAILITSLYLITKSILVAVLITIIVVVLAESNATYSVNKTNIITQYTIYKKAKSNIEKLVKGDWYITKMRRSSISRISMRTYAIFVMVKNDNIIDNDNNNNTNWSCSYIEVDKQGKILKEDLTGTCALFESFARENNGYKIE